MKKAPQKLLIRACTEMSANTRDKLLYCVYALSSVQAQIKKFFAELFFKKATSSRPQAPLDKSKLYHLGQLFCRLGGALEIGYGINVVV